MNKIYKVKKNAAGHLVACSEFAKGHTKKAVLGSLLIVGILGMATTASAQRNTGQNQATGKYSTVGGIGSSGFFNQAIGDYSTVGGGYINAAEGNYSTVGGGYGNKAKGARSTIGGGDDNEAEGMHSTIGGGDDNTAKGKYSTVGGGGYNQATGENSTVAGGYYNKATGFGSFATGTSNHAIGGMSTISGGGANKATGVQSSIGGGVLNQATGENSTVAGGYYNQAIGNNSTIAGGSHNQAIGIGSFAAGVENKANADNAVAVGKKNIIEGENSVAIGSNNTVAKGQKNVFILGSNTNDAQSNSVLLGNNTSGKAATIVENAKVNGLTLENFAGVSKANSGTVSVGSQGEERQIVNVGAGEISANSTDAVNGSQLYALASTIDEEVGAISEEVGALGDEIADINDELEGFAAHVDTQDKQILQNQADIAKNNDSIEDLYEATNENLDKISQLDGAVFNNTQNIEDLAAYNELQDAYAKQQTEAIDALNKASSENTQNIAKNSNHIKTLESNVEEGLLDLSGRLIDQKADIAKNQADIAQNQTDIQDLAAYNELQDAYAKQQTEAIDALNKASSANTDRIATAELGIAENKKDAQIAKAQANENKDGIAKNQADIANNIKNIYELAQQQDQHSSDIKTLAKVSAANTDRIAKNKAEADASFETLTKNQNTLIEQGEALVEQNKAINQELEGFAAHADVQDKQILQNQADITTNKTAIEQNINRTVANGFEIEKNKAGIATNKQELIIQNNRLNRINETNNRQDQKIDQLGYALKEQGQYFNSRISAVERQTAGGIANAIAIATLPSPNRAGEHHVLFGSGYHNGQAAVSLGAAGSSDTGKSTYKIGLSWSDAGGLSGGVGGSYRWK